LNTISNEKLEEIFKKRENIPFELIEILQDIQKEFGYLPEDVLISVSRKLSIPLIEVFRVANFYKAFSLTPRGKYIITICSGTACHVRGSVKLVDEVLGYLKLNPGETTEDNLFTVEKVNCVGACALGPVVIINGKYYDHMTAGKLRKEIERIQKENNK